MLENGKIVTVKDLLKALYEKACTQKLWGLVRHTAGMLGKRVEDLAKAVTDLLVRQKQITVGMPPNNEHTITAPLPENELRQLIHMVSFNLIKPRKNLYTKTYYCIYVTKKIATGYNYQPNYYFCDVV